MKRAEDQGCKPGGAIELTPKRLRVYKDHITGRYDMKACMKSGVKAAKGPKRAAAASRRVEVHRWVLSACATASLFGGTGSLRGTGLKSSAKLLREAVA